MASRATFIILMIALAAAVAQPVFEKASGLLPIEDSLSSNDIEDTTRAVVDRQPDEEESDDYNEVGGESRELLDDELGDGEAMDGEETVVFRPLFVHRQRQARRRQRRLQQQQRWSNYYGTRYGRRHPRVYY